MNTDRVYDAAHGRSPARRRAADGRDQALHIVCRRPPRRLEPGLARRPRRLGPDRHGRNARSRAPERPRGRSRREHDEIALGRQLRPELAGAIEGDEVGLERVGQEPRAPSAPANSTRPAGRGNSASEALLGRDRGTRSAPPNASAVAGPIAATRGIAPRPTRSSRAPLALVTTTQSYPATSIGSSPSGSTRSAGSDDLVAERLEPGDSSCSWPSGRVTTTSSASGISSAASVAGSRPVRRSTQVPSSAAISAVRRSRRGTRRPERDNRPDERHTAPLGLDPRRVSGRRRARRDLLAGAYLQGERSLTGLGQHHLRVEPEPDLVSRPKRSRPHAASTIASRPRSPLLRSRVSMLPRRGSIESVGSRARAGPPAGRCSADPHPGPDRVRPAERVAGILAFGVGPDDEAVGIGGGHVLRRMDSDVDPALEQCLLQLLDEDPAGTDLTQRARPVAIARSRDRNECDLPRPAQRLAARSAWVSASLLPREPTRSSTDTNLVRGSPHRRRPRGRIRTNASVPATGNGLPKITGRVTLLLLPQSEQVPHDVA